jgi:hypothetical protein
MAVPVIMENTHIELYQLRPSLDMTLAHLAQRHRQQLFLLQLRQQQLVFLLPMLPVETLL